MKGLVVMADIHAHPYRDHAVETGGMNSRLQDCVDAMTRGLEYALRDNHDVIIAGDIFHVKGSVSVEAMNDVVDCLHNFASRGLKITVIPGNHDMAGNGCHALQILSLLGIDVISDVAHRIYDWGTPCFVPFLPTKDLGSALGKVITFSSLPVRRPRILVGHFWVNELMIRSTGVLGHISAADLVEHFDLILLGHQHKHDIIEIKRSDGTPVKVVSIGAPLQHNFGDAGQKRGFCVVDLETLNVEHVSVKSREFFLLDGVKKIPEGAKEGFVRIKASKGDIEKFKKKLSSAGVESVDVELIPDKREARIDIAPGLRDSDIIGRFVDSEWGKTELDRAMLMKAGLRFLGEVP